MTPMILLALLSQSSRARGSLDWGEHAQITRNESGAATTNIATHFAPVGAALRIDQLQPNNCLPF